MKDRFEFYKEKYFFELERKNQLTQAYAIPIGFLTAIFAVFGFIATNFHFSWNKTLLILFCICLAGTMFFLIRACYYLYRAFRPLSYGYVPNVRKIYEYEEKYELFLKKSGGDSTKLDKAFFTNLTKSLVNTTEKNKNNNDYRSQSLSKANTNTLWAVLLLLLTTIPFFTSSLMNQWNENNNPKTNNEMITQQTDPKDDEQTNDDLEPTFPTDEYIQESLNIDFPDDSSGENPIPNSEKDDE